MTPKATATQQPSHGVSIAIFVAAVGAMGWLRLSVFDDQIIALTYGLPMLVCIWHRDLRLLWGMAAAFIGMAAYKAFFLVPSNADADAEILQWAMQVVDILVIGGALHIVISLTTRLNQKNLELEKANEELTSRSEEISRQNEELEAQSEELLQQNAEIQAQAEELSQQNEELQQQSEELQAQAEELHTLNFELNQREAMLQTLLETVNVKGGDQPVLQRICQSLIELFGAPVIAAAVIEKNERGLIVSSQVGVSEGVDPAFVLESTLAGIVLEHERTACLEDIAMRPDLRAPKLVDGSVAGILSTPLRLDGKTVGALEVYSLSPQRWTKKHFRLIEWVAAQCSLNMEARRLRQAMARANEHLEKTVTERTAKLQDMVHELEHFSYTITHDMRAPLRAMQGYAEMLDEEYDELTDAECKRYLQRIISATSRMDRLITDALSYSKTVQQEMELTPVDTGKLLRGIIDSYPMFQQPQAHVEMVGKLPVVLGNEAGLTQCFSNLLSNAAKFVPPGEQPRITIRAERCDRGVRLLFEDQGIGIAPHMQARIFRMFQRASKDYEGTGIGLALVRKVP
ncbi:MAG: ATP-binding protein, partial [Limisphaerales bacterium]